MNNPALELRVIKRLGIVLSITALTGLFFPAHGVAQQQRTAPFGLHPGMTVDQIKTAVGEQNVSPIPNSKGVYLLSSVPEKAEFFDNFFVAVSSKRGLAKLGAGFSFKSNRSGQQVRENFQKVESLLIGKYGKPTDHHDYVHAGAIFREDDEFMAALLQGERELRSFWKLDDGTLLLLEAKAHDSTTALISLTYEFHPEFDDFKEETTNKNDSAQ
jgi:hypothetical protein